jgi:hypothetical protein
MSEQIEGSSGSPKTVLGNKDSDDPTIELKDMGRGFNTEMTLRSLGANRAKYEHDKGIEELYNQMPQPVTPYPGTIPENVDRGLDK